MNTLFSRILHRMLKRRILERTYRDKDGWARMAVLNTAKSGKFSSDRTIREYADEIWNLKPLHIEL